MPGADRYQFGPFRYDPAQRQLFRDGQPVPDMKAKLPISLDELEKSKH